MVKISVKPYIIAKSSSSKESPDSTIQGEDVTIDSDEYKIRPKTVKQSIINDFTNWLTKNGKYPNRAKILSTSGIEVTMDGLPEEEEEETEIEKLWKQASRIVEDENAWRRTFTELSGELGRTPTLEEVERRL